MTFLGVSTLLIDDGTSALMIDGFFSRPGLLRLAAGLDPAQADALWADARAGWKESAPPPAEIALLQVRLKAFSAAHSHDQHEEPPAP